MNKYIVSSALLLTTGTPVFAQDITYANIGLGYGAISTGSEDLSVLVLFGESEYQIDQLFMGAALGYSRLAFEDDSLSFAELGVQVGYLPIEGVLAGVEFAQMTTTYTEGALEEDATGYLLGLFGQYEGPQFGVAVRHVQTEFEGSEQPSLTSFYGNVSVTPEISLLANAESLEESDGIDYAYGARYETGQIEAVASFSSNTESEVGYFAVKGIYDVNDQLAVLGSYDRNTGVDFDIAFVNLATAYSINDAIKLKAGIQSEIGSDATDYTSVFVGADYELAPTTTVSIDYGQQNEGSFEASSFTVSMSYELGETARLDRRITHDFEIDQIFDGVFFGGGSI